MSYALLSTTQYPYKLGDKGQLLEAGLTVDGVPYDLTDSTQILLRLRSPLGTDQTFPCEVVGDPTLGNVRYEWTGLEIVTPGIYLAEWVVYQPDRELTFPRGSQPPLQIVARSRI